MRSIVFVTALTAGVFNPYAPLTIDHAKLNTDLAEFSAKLNTDLAKFSETSVVFFSRALTPVKPEAAPIDAAASAKVDEDLDYRIAEQRKSIDGWRAFLSRIQQARMRRQRNRSSTSCSLLPRRRLPKRR
jgi:hypothetical protein